jgi:hypothetical protein
VLLQDLVQLAMRQDVRERAGRGEAAHAVAGQVHTIVHVTQKQTEVGGWKVRKY